MATVYRKGATGALLDEYEKAIAELKQVINDVTNEELTAIADIETMDENCRSIQTVLGHVVRSCFSYAVYIRNLYGEKLNRPDIILRSSVNAYQKDLDNGFAYNVATFENIKDNEIEKFGESEKILTVWHQVYDIEQMMEHAIVHILRHRRQIEKFKLALR